MIVLLEFVGIALATLLVLAFAMALISRFWEIRPEPVTLRGIDVERARDVVAAYVEEVHDTRFGFPTGVFRIEERRSTPTTLVARETNFRGSVGMQLVRMLLVIPMWLGAAAADAGPLWAIVAVSFGLVFTALLIGPLVVIIAIEVVLRLLMRGEVRAELATAPDDEDACTVQFTLRGLSAYGVSRQLLGGLAAPVLPTAYGGSHLANAPEPWQRDRLNVVYASGGAIAVAVALLVVVLAPGLRGSSPSAPGYDAALASDTYDDSSSGYDDSSSGYDDSSSGYDDSSSGYDDSASDYDDGSSSEEDGDGGVATTASGDGFTIEPPEGWERDAYEEEHDGYVESHWRAPGEKRVSFLVDHTRGFSGTAKSGAVAVRRGFLAFDDYDEYAFEATDVAGDPGWRWEFEHDGLHKLDIFRTACGTGYAILGTAPSDRWYEFADQFEQAAMSLSPECDESGGDDAGSAGAPPDEVLRTHFQLLGEGDGEGAFALTSPRYQRQTPNWVTARTASEPAIGPLDTRPVQIDGDEAWVGVVFYARDRVETSRGDTKCRRFSGNAHFRRVDGEWRYDPPGNDYRYRVVDASNPQCP